MRKPGEKVDPLALGLAAVDPAEIMRSLGYEVIKGPIHEEELPQDVLSALQSERAKVKPPKRAQADYFGCAECGTRNWGAWMDDGDGVLYRVCGSCYTVTEVK